MKLQELQRPLLEGRYLKRFTKEQIANFVQKAMALPEYEALVKAQPDKIVKGQYADFKANRTMYDLSGKIQRELGTFEFSHQIARSKDHHYRCYTVMLNGSVNYGGSQMRSVAVPGLTNDPVENYRRMFERVYDLVHDPESHTRRKDPPVREYAPLETDTIDFIEEGDPLTLKSLQVKNLQGAPREVSQYSLKDMKLLENLAGGPDAAWTAKIELADCPNLTSLLGFPTKVSTHLNVSLSRCPKLTTLEGITAPMSGLWLWNMRGLKSFQGIGQRYVPATAVIHIDTPHLIKSHVLGLALVKGLQTIVNQGSSIASSDLSQLTASGRAPVRNAPWLPIVNQVLKDESTPHARVLELQHALLDANLDEYAQL